MKQTLDPQEIAALLPFFANGTISASQRAEFDTALANDGDLRAQLEIARGQMEFIKAGAAQLFENTAQNSDPETRLALIRQKIDNFESKKASAPIFKIKAAPKINLGLLFGEFFGQHFKPSLLIAGAIIGALCIGLGLRVFEIIAPQPKSEYVTMAGPNDVPKVAKTRFLIRLRPHANWQQIEELLRAEDAQIISGPNDGLIQIEMKNELGERAIEALNARLSASPYVEFVGAMP